MKQFDKERREEFIFCLSPVWAVLLGLIIGLSCKCCCTTAYAQGTLHEVYAKYKMNLMKQPKETPKYLNEEFPQAWEIYKKLIDSLGVSVIPSYCYKAHYDVPKKENRWSEKVIVTHVASVISGRFLIDRGDGLGYYALYYDDDPQTYMRLLQWEETWAYYIYAKDYFMNNTFEQNIRHYYASVADFNHTCNEEEKLIKMYNQIEQKVAEVLKYVEKYPKEKRFLEEYYKEQYYSDISSRWMKHYRHISSNREYPHLKRFNPVNSKWGSFD
jgi:hypothetical protein